MAIFIYLRTIDRNLQNELIGNNSGWGLQIHMIIHGAFRAQAETMAEEEGGMIHIEHFRGISGLVKEGLIVLSLMKGGRRR